MDGGGNAERSAVERAFVGRERERAELRAALDDADNGRGRLFLISGEPGIGKTRRDCGRSWSGLSGLILAVVLALTVPMCVRFAQANAGQAKVSTLSTLAIERFHVLTPAERKMLDYADIDNADRSGWVTCGPSADPNDPSNDPRNAASWSHDRDIRAQLIRWLAADARASLRVDRKGLRVLGARISGPLDLSQLRVPFAIALVQCSIPERMNLESTSVPFFDLAGSAIGEIFGPNMNVEGDLDIGYDNNPFRDTWASGEVFLTGSKVGGCANFSSGHYHHSKVEPRNWGAAQKKALDLGGLDVKSALELGFGFESRGAVILDDVKVGKLQLNSGRFLNPDNIAISARNARVETNVEAGQFERFGLFEADGVVDFTTATVGDNFYINDARFEGKAGERHGLVAQGLTVPKGFVWLNVALENGAVLDLRGAHVGALIDDQRSWPSPGKLLIDGFVWNSFGADSPRSAPARLQWLHLQPDFHGQPYIQLAQVLRQEGDDAGADYLTAAQSDGASTGSRFVNLFRQQRRIIVSMIILLGFAAIAALYYRRRNRASPFEQSRSYISFPGVEIPPPVPPARRATGPLSPAERLHRIDGANPDPDRDETESVAAVLIRQGDFWTTTYRGATIRLKDAKGLHYLAYLLARPGERIHVLDLITAVEGSAADAHSYQLARSDGLEIVQDNGGPAIALDSRARSEYATRLREARAELEEANRFNDAGRSERLRAEVEVLGDELNAGFGRRAASDGAERARSMVSKRIRATLDKISELNPMLGRHFAVSIKTGYFCAYLPDPDHKIAWQL